MWINGHLGLGCHSWSLLVRLRDLSSKGVDGSVCLIGSHNLHYVDVHVIGIIIVITIFKDLFRIINTHRLHFNINTASNVLKTRWCVIIFLSIFTSRWLFRPASTGIKDGRIGFLLFTLQIVYLLLLIIIVWDQYTRLLLIFKLNLPCLLYMILYFY